MIDSQKSSDKIRAASTAEAPFGRTDEGILTVDTEKLAKLWASNTEAMLAVGEGLENVVAAANSLIQDNGRTRDHVAGVQKSFDHVRKLAIVAIGANLLTVASLATFLLIKALV